MTAEEYSGTDNLELMEALASNYNGFLVRSVLKALSGCGEVVDFGAGTGFFARAVRKCGFQVRCVEVDQRLRARLVASGLSVNDGLPAFSNNSVDGIYSLNVLEHIQDDENILLQMFRVLRPGGRLFIFVPALGFLYSSMDAKVGHVRRYSAGSLRALLTRAGLHVDELRYADSLGVLATLAYKALWIKTGDLSPRGLLLYDRLVFPLSATLDTFFSHLAGKNVYAIATKPT